METTTATEADVPAAFRAPAGQPVPRQPTGALNPLPLHWFQKDAVAAAVREVKDGGRATVVAATGSGALDALRRPDGTLTTALRLGVSPGHVKFEGSRPMGEVLELMADGANPARHIKTGGLVSDDE